MSVYELVIVVDPNTTQEFRDAIDAEIKNLVGADAVKSTDDMGLVQFSYEMLQKKGLHQGFVTSYHLSIESDVVDEVKQVLSYKKELLRCVFFSMKANQEYFTLEAITEKVTPLVESDEWTMKKKITLLETKEHDHLLVWKAVPLLKKFVTRFGDIKPRKYTGISVAQQKTIRIAIQRARELGFMSYIR